MVAKLAFDWRIRVDGRGDRRRLERKSRVLDAADERAARHPAQIAAAARLVLAELRASTRPINTAADGGSAPDKGAARTHICRHDVEGLACLEAVDGLERLALLLALRRGIDDDGRASGRASARARDAA
jgi:hypothetical protein